MTSPTPLVARIGLVVVLVAAAVDAGLFVAAFTHLGQGPRTAGYQFLLAANRLAVGVAALVALRAVAVVAAGAPGVRRRCLRLMVAAAVSFGFALTLDLLGRSLSSFEVEQQPVRLNSLLMAVWGTGHDLAPAAAVLALAAALLPFTVLARDRWLERRAAAAPIRLVRHPR